MILENGIYILEIIELVYNFIVVKIWKQIKTMPLDYFYLKEL
jgi:hypothetical protein